MAKKHTTSTFMKEELRILLPSKFRQHFAVILYVFFFYFLIFCYRQFSTITRKYFFINEFNFQARKALRALKGLVRLQAIVRGRAVRRQAIATLKSLQSIVNIQSEVCAKRCDSQVKTTLHCQENTLLDLGEKDIKVRSCAMLQSNLT